MDSGVWNMISMAGAFLTLFALAEGLYHWGNMAAESTRKLVHVGTGLLALLFPITLGNHWQVLLLCSIFAVFLMLSMKYGLLQSINAIRRESYGSLGYPAAVYCSFLAFEYFDKQYIYYYLPIVILAICDPFAAYVGRKKRYKPYRVGKDIKTVGGSLAFFCSAILVTAGIYLYLRNFPGIWRFAGIALSVGLCATLAEARSKKGFDNITIPAAVLVVLIIMEQFIYR